MIYAHIGISEEKLSKICTTINQDNKEVSYSANYSSELVVDMPFLGEGEKKANAGGWLRSPRVYYKELLKNHPSCFSNKNKEKISKGRSPIVDEQFMEHFPEYKGYKDDLLIHHHIGEDGQAVAVPITIHPGYGGIHNLEKEIGVTANAEKHSALCQKFLDDNNRPPDSKEVADIIIGSYSKNHINISDSSKTVKEPISKSSVITRDKITLKCPYPIWDFYDLEITHEINEHAKLKVVALLESGIPGSEEFENIQNLIYEIKEHEEIQVTIQNEYDTEILFTGIPVKVDISITQNNCLMMLECYSGTYDMDMRESSRSFQDVSMKYSDMFSFVASHYPNADSTNIAAIDKTINRPVIQYKETDWEFLKRMASEVGTVLTADIESKNAKFFLGTPNHQEKVTIGAEKPLKRRKHETRLRNRRDMRNPLEYSKYNHPIEQENHYYYETTIPNEHIKIGDKVDVLGDIVIVTKATFKYSKDDGVLRNLYRLEQPPKIKRYGNERVKGIGLEGKVLDVKLDHIKLHLDIDPSQDVDKAFWYPCKAEANNVWYTMPHIGERVYLHIVDITETGLCMTETRRDREQPVEEGIGRPLRKPTEKYMLTKWHQQMALHEKDIEWDSNESVNILMTEESVYIESNDTINIETDTEINIGKTELTYFENGEKRTRVEETKNIIFEAEELLTFKVTNTESVIELDEYNKIHSPTDVKQFGGHSIPTPIVRR